MCYSIKCEDLHSTLIKYKDWGVALERAKNEIYIPL